jgi:hypothetical protein
MSRCCRRGPSRRVHLPRRLTADDVQGLVIDAGHWLAEQAPEQMLAALTAFLLPNRDAATAGASGTPVASA